MPYVASTQQGDSSVDVEIPITAVEKFIDLLVMKTFARNLKWKTLLPKNNNTGKTFQIVTDLRNFTIQIRATQNAFHLRLWNTDSITSYEILYGSPLCQKIAELFTLATEGPAVSGGRLNNLDHPIWLLVMTEESPLV